MVTHRLMKKSLRSSGIGSSEFIEPNAIEIAKDGTSNTELVNACCRRSIHSRAKKPNYRSYCNKYFEDCDFTSHDERDCVTIISLP